MYPARRGRKSSRKQSGYLNKVFNDGFKVRQLSLYSKLSSDTIYKRFAKNLDSTINRVRVVRIRGTKLIILIDAKWQYFKKELWTMYFLAVKSTDSGTVTVFDPIIKQGKESAANWDEIINQMPPAIKKRVVTLVSDGIRGIETIATNNGWVIQRCHFHLLSALQRMRGKRASTHGRIIREEIYCTVKLALAVTSINKLFILCRRLDVLAKQEGCPRAMRMVVRDFLRRLSEFRSYLNYPKLNLPTTTNVMESINSYIGRIAKTTNTPKSWHKWAIACIRFKSKFTCK